MIQGGAPAPLLRGEELCLSVVPGLDGVTDVAVIVDLVVHGGRPRRKVVPSLLPRLGTLGPWPVGAVAKGITIAPHRMWGVSIKMPPPH